MNNLIKFTFRPGKPSDAIVTDGEMHDQQTTFHYGGRVVCESVDPEFKALLIVAPKLLGTAKKLMAWMETMNEDLRADGYKSYVPICSELKQIIAEAEGRQP